MNHTRAPSRMTRRQPPTSLRSTMAAVLVLSVLVTSLLASVLAQPALGSGLDPIDAYIDEQMRAHLIPGLALVIIDDGEIVGLRGYGRADSAGREMTPRTPVNMGSLSKAFTALAVMQLVEAGQVGLDTPVQHYLPWFTLNDAAASAAITVRHLLNQTSGIPNAVGLEHCLCDGDATMAEKVRELSDVTPAFAPGTRFQYSNANYEVLGVLVEAVAAESFGTYVRSHIFTPLQMRDSYASLKEAKDNGLVAGYRRWFGFPLPADLPYLQHGLVPGYLIASAEDIAHFLVANLNGGVYKDMRVLSADGVAELHRPAADAGDVSYAMGWVVGDVGGVPAVYHHGSTPDFHVTMMMEPEKRQGVVVVSNVNLFEMWHVGPSSVIAEGVLDLLRGQPTPAGGATVRARYLTADLVALGLTALTALSLALTRRWQRQLRARPPRSTVGFVRYLALPVLAGTTWSFTILFAFPDISNLPSWGFWLLFQPDFSLWLIAIAAVIAVKAVAAVVTTFRIIQATWTRLGWRSVVGGAVLAEVIFLALFFLVMFMSHGPAAFVALSLAVVFALESPAHFSRQASRGGGQPSLTGISNERS